MVSCATGRFQKAGKAYGVQVRLNDAWLDVISTGAVTWNRTQPVPELVNVRGKLSE
jgi:hypothetical protein